MIDVSGINHVTPRGGRRVDVGPGARWIDVARTLRPLDLAITSGDYGGVGVGGLATAGGIGFLAREHGLTIDHLRSARVVLADGTVVTASADDNAELFWGIRGAGGNLGIVTSFEFEVDEVTDVGWAELAYDATDTAGLLERWGAAVEAAPRELTSFLLMGGGQTAQTMTVIDSTEPETIIEMLQPFAEIAPLVQQSVVLKPYAAVMANSTGAPHSAQGEPLFRSGLVEHITPEFAEAIAALLATGLVPFFQIRSVGGAVNDVAEDATAYAHRTANFSIAAVGSSPRLNAEWQKLGEHFTGLYLSFETDQSPERLGEAFPPATLARLRALKAEVDPVNVFRDNFNVGAQH